MDIITKKLPEGVLIDGSFYPVYTDFKNWIRISVLFEEGNINEEKLLAAFSLCYRTLPETIDKAFDGMLDFYMPDKSRINKERGSAKSRIFSFKEDSELIYAAFLSQYNIDLSKASLHWYQFMALFRALTKEHKLFEVIFIRDAKLSDIKDKEKRAYIAKMKRIYSLADNRTEEEKSESIASSMAELFYN